jgi:hypothetical protein
MPNYSTCRQWVTNKKGPAERISKPFFEMLKYVKFIIIANS